MSAHVLVLPSPLLPAVVYSGLVQALREQGCDASTADPGPAVDSPIDDVVEQWSAAAAQTDLLVAHSNAGLLAPLVRARARPTGRVVFMDAALPPEAGSATLAPPALRTMLAGLADDDGLLPPWTRWWPPEAVAAAIPARMLAQVDSACPRLPTAYFDQRVAAPEGWVSAANAFLAFGDTYAAELELAREHGWLTSTMDGSHLHFLHEPDEVAHRLLVLAERTG